jgi:transposase
MTAVAITRTDMTSAQLRAAAGREKDGAAARRILALALVLEGTDRTTAAKTCGMDRQTLRDWVHRYNNEGLAGLRNRKPSGRPSSLTAQQKAVLCQLVEHGPDPAVHKVVRWRRRDLAAELERRFGVKLHERSVGDLLASLGYRRLSVRPRHPQTDEAAQETFKKTLPRRLPTNSQTMPRASQSKSGSRMRRASASRAR